VADIGFISTRLYNKSIKLSDDAQPRALSVFYWRATADAAKTICRIRFQTGSFRSRFEDAPCLIPDFYIGTTQNLAEDHLATDIDMDPVSIIIKNIPDIKLSGM